MSINEEDELKTILYENLELFDLIDRYCKDVRTEKSGLFGLGFGIFGG